MTRSAFSIVFFFERFDRRAFLIFAALYLQPTRITTGFVFSIYPSLNCLSGLNFTFAFCFIKHCLKEPNLSSGEDDDTFVVCVYIHIYIQAYMHTFMVQCTFVSFISEDVVNMHTYKHTCIHSWFNAPL
jgi:hypothetical protein